MKIPNNHLLLSVDMEQRDRLTIAGSEMLSAARYSENWRHKSPAVATVVQGNDQILTGWTIVCTYTIFNDTVGESPYSIGDGLFVVPVGDLIMGRIDENGNFHPLCDHIVVREVEKPTFLPMPDEFRKPKVNHGFVVSECAGYKEGDEILWLNYSNYQVLWKWDGEDRSVVVIEKAEVCGKVVS